jgi:hypothetical protein
LDNHPGRRLRRSSQDGESCWNRVGGTLIELFKTRTDNEYRGYLSALPVDVLRMIIDVLAEESNADVPDNYRLLYATRPQDLKHLRLTCRAFNAVVTQYLIRTLVVTSVQDEIDRLVELSTHERNSMPSLYKLQSIPYHSFILDPGRSSIQPTGLIFPDRGAMLQEISSR